MLKTDLYSAIKSEDSDVWLQYIKFTDTANCSVGLLWHLVVDWCTETQLNWKHKLEYLNSESKNKL